MPPVNDDIAARIDLGVLPAGDTNVSGTTVAATTDAWEGFSGFVDVWYEFTAPAAGDTSIRNVSCSYAIYADLETLNSDPPGSWSDLSYAGIDVGDGTNTPPDSSDITLTPGATYVIYVSSWNSPDSGTFSFDLHVTTAPPPPPDNDDYPINFTEFFDRTEYYLGRNSGGCLAGTTLDATAQAGEPDPAPGFPATHSVWFTLEPPVDGTIRFWITSSDPDMADGILSVYDWVGGPPSGLGAPIAQGDDELGTQPQCDATVVGGDDYVVQVDTRDAGGAFTLHWEYLPVGSPPANDDFADAQDLGGDCGQLAVTLTDANAECGEPTGADDPDGPYNTVWYSWTPAWTGQAFVTIQGVSSGFHDLDLDVFVGASLAGLALVDSHEFFGTPPATASRTFSVTAGTTYYLRWQGRGEPLTFTMTWETDENPWKARIGSLNAGDATFDTGLGETPAGVIVYAAGIADGTIARGARIGVGCATPDGQWGSSYAYPWRDNDLTNGSQYGQNRFSSTAVISVVDLDGTVYAEAEITAFNSDGTIDLNWLTDPGDGLWLGFAAFSGITAEVGVIDMDGTPGVTTLTPADPTTRIMVASVTADHAGAGPTAPATNWTMQGWAETMIHTADTAITTGIETGISWYGGSDDEGILLLGNDYGAFFNVTADMISQFVGCPSFDVTLLDGWVGKFGWLALGGCGWHGYGTGQILGSGTFPSTFWTQAGLALGAGGYPIVSPTNNSGDGTAQFNVGAFDETDAQFGFSELFYPATGGFGNFQTPTTRAGYEDRIFSDQDSYTTEGGHTTIDLPGRPTLGGTITRTGSGDFAGGGGYMFLLGNYVSASLASLFVPQIIRYR